MKKGLFIFAGIALAAFLILRALNRSATAPELKVNYPSYESDCYEAWHQCQERIKELEAKLDEMKWTRKGDTLIYQDEAHKIIYPNHGINIPSYDRR